jgi:hypothetical protein
MMIGSILMPVNAVAYGVVTPDVDGAVLPDVTIVFVHPP